MPVTRVAETARPERVGPPRRTPAHGGLPTYIVGIGLCLAACGGGGGGGDAGSGDALPDTMPRVDPLMGIGAVELVDGGHEFLEGPQWRDAEGDLVFSDIPRDTSYRMQPGSAPVVFRSPSGNSNGHAVDPAGAVLAAEHGTRSVTRTVGAGTTTVIDRFEGSRLNSPNDVVVADDGTIYFTDPPYGITDPERELAFVGVFRVAPGGAITAEYRGGLGERPNGIGLSPDGAAVYVADTADGNLYRFAIEGTGALGTRDLVTATSGNPDGLAIDAAGNVFVSTTAGIEVFAPDGSRWGAIAVDEQPANCAFGDADHRTLYITARTSLYKVRLANAGLPRR